MGAAATDPDKREPNRHFWLVFRFLAGPLLKPFYPLIGKLQHGRDDDN